MYRLSNEEGRQASARNLGRLALAIIPAALGGAAALWILAASGYIDLRKEIRAEERVTKSVGLTSVPVAPVKFKSHDAQCLRIDFAFMRDSEHFAFYAKNVCRDWLKDPAYSYHVLANGTTVESNSYIFSGDKQIGPSERREQSVWIKDGISRVDSIEIWIQD